MSKHTWLTDGTYSKETRLSIALQEFSSNLYHMLVSGSEETRFLKVKQRGQGDWLSIIGAYSEDGSPVVAYGQGSTYVSSLMNLSSSIAAGAWKPDKYA